MKINLKYLLISLAAVLAIVIVLLLVKTSTSDKYQLFIEAYPRDTEITIGDKKYKSPVDIKTDPGDYTVHYQRYGFKNIELTYSVNQDKKIFIVLDPITEDAKEWSEKNKDLYDKQAKLDQQAAVESAHNTAQEKPILKVLPKTTDAYAVGASQPKDDPYTTVIIRSQEASEFKAIAYLQQFNIDLSPYKYKFINSIDGSAITNPFIAEKGDLDE